MSKLTIESFHKLINDALEYNIDFLLISGDLFNTSLPAIDYIKEVVKDLQRLKTEDIPVYIIPGSHDFSPSGKTMLGVLEEAKLVINVVKITERDLENGEKKFQLNITKDKKTNTEITGMLGKKNMLERKFYENLDYSNIKVDTDAEYLLTNTHNNPYRIFMFHSAIDELKPKELAKMESSPISLLPTGFDYYAGGHVHIVEKQDVAGYKNVIYPGPLFPNSFTELEKLGRGGYYLYDNGNIIFKEVKLKEISKFVIDCENKTPEEVSEYIKELILDIDCTDKIVLFRFRGKLKIGKVLDIDTKFIMSLYEKGAYFVMKNTSNLSSQDFEEVRKDFDKDCIEEEIIEEHLGQINIDGINRMHEKEMILKLMKILSSEQDEGETKSVYEQRILQDIDMIK